MGINGTKEVVPLATSTYGIACSGPGGEVAKSVTVTVPEPATAAAGLTALVALLSLGAKPRRRMPAASLRRCWGRRSRWLRRRRWRSRTRSRRAPCSRRPCRE